MQLLTAMRQVLLTGLATTSIVNAQSTPTASTPQGTIVGRYLSEFNQDLFLGVPYGDAPRLANPRAITTKYTNGTFDASQYGPACYGFGSNQSLNLTQSEDCLNLNVVRPTGTFDQGPLPVLLWIYGGGWRQGATSDPMWNLTYIVQQSVQQGQPIMAVSINYRLSFLGFPGGKEALAANVTNLGLKDQRFALQWVQKNIGNFFGDPSKVTIWGESAGGSSVASHLISYGGTGSKGLFRGGILVSGFETGINPAKPNNTQPGYDAIVKNANCSAAANTLACLRQAPLSAIYPFEDTVATWTPVIDGAFIAQEPAKELFAGHVTKVPIVLGCDSDEGIFITNTLNYFPNSTAELRAIMTEAFPGLNASIITDILAAYPVSAPAPPYSLPISYPWCAALAEAGLACGSQYRRQSGILGDFFAHAARRLMAQQWAKLGLPTWSFRFDTDPTRVPIVTFTGLGPGFAEHGSELAYEFGLPPGFTTGYYPAVNTSAPHAQLSLDMIAKWISFASVGDVNDAERPDVPFWPSYTQSASNLVWNATTTKLNIHVEKDTYRAKGIKLWNDNVLASSYGPQ